ncbi:MAG: hypothetical protein ACTHNY_07050 [Solirubrobacterales bacterium]
MLEVIRSQFDLSPAVMRREIEQALEITVDAIAAKGVQYSKLKNALIPQRDRWERAFLFDTDRIEEGWYGLPVAEALIPLLPRQLSCSIQLGDLIIEDQELGFDLLRSYAVPCRPVQLGYTNQIYCLYLNNLTRTMAESITEGLRGYEGFCGYVDATFSSPMKDWLSVTLVDGYLKHRGTVLNGHEDDVPDEEDRNMKGWPWEAHGYSCRSIRDMYFHLFLSYKIERRVLPWAETDTHFALTAISGRPLPLADLDVEVAAAKRKYLQENHGSSLARAGLIELSEEKLAEMIKDKINDSYIYYLRYLEEHDSSLFNLMLEVEDPEKERVTRLLASLEYCPQQRLLKLVTLF